MKKSFTVLDLFRYKSLAGPTVIFSLLILFIDFIYFGHITIIDRIGFNATLNQALLSSSEIVGIILSLSFSTIVPRKTFGMLLYFVSLILLIIGLLVKVPAGCIECFEAFV